MTYRDSALTAYQQALAAQEAARAEARAALVTAAKQAVIPLFTDGEGKLVLDPLKVTVDVHVDESARLVILQTTDGSDVHFAVYPEKQPAELYIAASRAGEWTRGPQVTSMAEVGKYFALAAGDAE